MVITLDYINLNMPKAKNTIIDLKKERNKMYLTLLLRPVDVSKGGRSRPLLLILDFKNGGLLVTCWYCPHPSGFCMRIF